jgi:hypothetical protein
LSLLPLKREITEHEHPQSFFFLKPQLFVRIAAHLSSPGR